MKIICLGDSLMQHNGEDSYPQKGWPDLLPEFLKDGSVTIADFAQNGRSTKSFIDEGFFDKARSEAAEGDIALISFGHNDEKDDPARHTEAFGSYQDLLIMMAHAFMLKGAHPVFISSFSRLHYDDKGVLIHSHGEYPKAMKEAAAKIGIPFIDLEKISYETLSHNDLKSNERYFMVLKKGEYPNYPNGLDDHSHLCVNGARLACSLVVPKLKEIPLFEGIFK